MTLVSQLAAEVAKDFRDSRKDKLKRTFVGAQDAAGAKAKGRLVTFRKYAYRAGLSYPYRYPRLENTSLD